MRSGAPLGILAAVRTSRWLVLSLLVLGALALSVPAVTLASGGGSAGDQQYTDPFGGTSAPKKGPSKPATTSTPATTTTSSPAATTPPPAPAATSPAAAADPTTATSDPTTPTATTANELPHTGYDSWMAGALGMALVGGGMLLRARVRRA
jgi:LPXTG-motif cell wall-anchored protein